MTRRIVLVDIGSGLVLSGVLPSVALFAAYSAKLSARGGVVPYSYAVIVGAELLAAAGLFLDAGTGSISGTAGVAGTIPFTVRVTDLSGAFLDRQFSITVIAEPLTLSGSAPDGTAGVEQSYTYTRNGGIPPCTFSLVGAPTGWSIPDETVPTVVMTAASGGAKTWIVRATDTAGAQFDLADAATFGYADLLITGTFPAATIAAPYDEYVMISGGDDDYTLTGGNGIASGDVPAGMALSIANTDELHLSGTPTSGGTDAFTASVDSGDGQTATSAQSVVVAAARADDFSTDDLFNYTEYSDLAAGWWIGGGLLQGTAGSEIPFQSVLTRNGVSFADGEISAVLIAAIDAGLALRLIDANNYYLCAIHDSGATLPNVLTIYKRVAGIFTALSSGSISFTRNTSHTLSFSATGSNLVAKFDGSVIATATDTSLPAAGKCGVRSNDTATVNVFDSFTWS